MERNNMCEKCNNPEQKESRFIGYSQVTGTNQMVDPETRSSELMEELNQYEINLESFAHLLTRLESKASSVIREELSRGDGAHPIPQRLTSTGRRLQNSNQTFESLAYRLEDIINRIEA